MIAGGRGGGGSAMSGGATRIPLSLVDFPDTLDRPITELASLRREYLSLLFWSFGDEDAS